MSKLLVVFGATGNQGGSVINTILNDPYLFREWKLRGLTRDPFRPDAQRLAQRGVEMASVNVDDRASVDTAVKGAHTVYALTIGNNDRDTLFDTEVRQGKTIADAVVASGAQHIIWSNVVYASKVSNGALKNVVFFDSKAEVWEYIQTLSIRSTALTLGSFMQNYIGMLAPRPSQRGDGSYEMANVMRGGTELPLIDVEADTGKWAAGVLMSPEKYEKKAICCAAEFVTLDQICEKIGKKTGKTVSYKQLPEDVFKNLIPGNMGEVITEMSVLFRDYGYFGKDQKRLVKEGVQQAQGELTTFEEFLKKVDYKLP